MARSVASACAMHPAVRQVCCPHAPGAICLRRRPEQALPAPAGAAADDAAQPALAGERTTEYCGIRATKAGRWKASIGGTKIGKIGLGTYISETEAAGVYDKALLARDGWCGHLPFARAARHGCLHYQRSKRGLSLLCAGSRAGASAHGLTSRGSSTQSGTASFGRPMARSVASACAMHPAVRQVRCPREPGAVCLRPAP